MKLRGIKVSNKLPYAPSEKNLYRQLRTWRLAGITKNGSGICGNWEINSKYLSEKNWKTHGGTVYIHT